MEEVDWRAYSATKGLTEKQQKLADKIRKRELRVQHLQSEVEKIKVPCSTPQQYPAAVPDSTPPRALRLKCELGNAVHPALLPNVSVRASRCTLLLPPLPAVQAAGDGGPERRAGINHCA